MTHDEAETGKLVPSSDLVMSAAIREMIESLGKDRSVQATGRSWKQLSRYANDAAEPPFSVVVSLARAAGQSLDRMVTDPASGTGAFLAGPMAPAMGDETQDFTLVPRYDVSASAGYGLAALAEEVTERLAFKTDWLRDMGLSPHFVGLVTCRGDSQYPVIKDGALMLVDMQPDQVIRSGCFYVIVLDGDVLVKKINRRVDGAIELISENTVYPVEVIDHQRLDKLTIPGRVVWAGQKL